jgi:hypothetical protein
MSGDCGHEPDAMLEALLSELEGTIGGYETAGAKGREELDKERAEIRAKICALKVPHEPSLRQPEGVAWIATRGDYVLHFSKHDGWNVETVLSDR